MEKKTNSFTKNTLIKTNSKNTKSNISELPENYSTLLIGKERKISFYQQTVNKNKFDRKDIEMSTFNSKEIPVNLKNCFPNLQLILDRYGSLTTKQRENEKISNNIQNFMIKNSILRVKFN